MSLVDSLYASLGLLLVGILLALRGLWLALKVARKRYLLLPLDRLDLHVAALGWLLAAMAAFIVAVLLTTFASERLRP